jgi:hypothetical protein
MDAQIRTDNYNPKKDRRLHTILDRMTKDSRSALKHVFWNFELKSITSTENEDGVGLSCSYEFGDVWKDPELKYRNFFESLAGTEGAAYRSALTLP